MTPTGLSGIAAFAARLPPDLTPERRAALEEQAAALGPWHEGPFPLGGDLIIGSPSSDDRRLQALGNLLPGSLGGLHVLDVGTRAGYDAFAFDGRGASYVLAIESGHEIEQARFLQAVYGTGIDFQRLAWTSLDPVTHGVFDLVHFHRIVDREVDVVGLLRRLHAMVAPRHGLLLACLTMLSDGEPADERMQMLAHGSSPTGWIPSRSAFRRLLDEAGFEFERAEFGETRSHDGLTVQDGYVVARAPAVTVVDASPPRDATPLPDGQTRMHVRFALGHYYSPMYDSRTLATEPRRSQVWPERVEDPRGIDWRPAQQRRLCTNVFARQSRLDFALDPTGDPTVYHARNDQYPALDAWILEAFLQHLRPRRMIEVGSGFSTLVSARVNRERLGNTMHFTCVEPYPRDFLVAGVPGVTDLVTTQVQDVPVTLYDELGRNDVLFIDTSHTVKTGGDVTWLYHHVLPRLKPGVYVHIHDIFLPDDYPYGWVMEGWGWNEQYLVQSFLSFNSAFEVVLGAAWMSHWAGDALTRAFPGRSKVSSTHGASLWIRRVGIPGFDDARRFTRHTVRTARRHLGRAKRHLRSLRSRT